MASKMPERPDLPIPFAGMTFGVAKMSENSPHDGEMHPDGDEVLFSCVLPVYRPYRWVAF